MQIELCDINYTIIEVKYGILIHVRSLPTINQISIVISSKYIHVYIVMTGLFNIIKMKFKFSIEREVKSREYLLVSHLLFIKCQNLQIRESGTLEI